MFGARGISKTTPPYNFPKTKLKNVTCVHCKHQFIVRELLNVRGQQVPLLLECGHSICYGCAKLHPNKPCPLCQLSVQVDQKSSELYPLHIYALGLAVIGNNRPIHGEEPDVSFYQTISSKLRHTQTQGVCYECEVEATFRCPQCNALYCQACYSKIHGRALQKHKKLRLTETIKDVSLPVVGNTCSDVCSEFLGYFCKDCETSSCSHCMLRFHSKHNHVTLRERNEELMENFYEAYDSVAEILQHVLQTQKKLKTIQISPTELRNQETIETSITQHFAHLHGVLQNIEKKMIDKIHQRRYCFNKNLMELETQLTGEQERLEAMLLMAANAKDNLDKIDIAEVVCKLKEMADVPCHLLQEKLGSDEKVCFEVDRSIIVALEKHCTLHIPSISEFNLLRTELLPENYQVEPLTHEITIPTCSSYTSNEFLSSLKKSISTASLVSSKLDITFQTDSLELVKVMNVVDPSYFYVQFWANRKQAEELSNSLQEYSINAPLACKEITVGSMYLVKYSRENVWRRGRVTKINSNLNRPNNTYDVFYVDNGYLERNVIITRFRIISPQIATIPILAVKCALHDVVPNGARWSKAATEEFRKLANMHVPIAMRIFNSHGSTHYVDLCFNPNDSQGNVISMRDALVLMQYGNFVSLQKIIRTNPLSIHRYFPEELDMEEWTEVIVQLAQSPDSIYVTKVGENKKYINKLTKDMTTFYEKNASLTTLFCPIEIGIPCALQHIDGSWYRGMITQIINENTVHVLCVDYGYTLIMNHRALRRLSTNYMSGRTQAIQIALQDLKPLTKDKGEWNSNTIEFVKKHLTNHKVQIIAMLKRDNIYCVYLYSEGNNNFNNLLVSKNYAEAIGVTSLIIPNNKHRPKKKKAVKSDRSLMYNMDEDDKTTSLAQTIDPDPFKVWVQVHQAQSPDSIYVSEESREKANVELMSKIQRFYTKYHSQEKIKWSKDAVCAVYSKKDKSYFRARILKILSEEEVVVFFYDLAIEEVISIDDIQPLNSTFQQEPAYLFKVKLAGILPCGGSGTWPSLSCQKLNDIISENQNCQFYITKVTDTEDSTEIPVQLWIKQSRPEGPLSPTKIEINSVNKMLVEAGLALPVKGYNDKVDKILAIEFKRQLQEMQVTSPNNEDLTEDIKWFSTSKITSDFSDTGSLEEEYSSAMNISNMALPQNLTDWLPPLPIESDNFIAIPTYLDHDGALYLHPKKNGKAILLDIEWLLNDNYKNVKIKPCDKEWKEGDICVAQYHGTKKWYRGKVQKVIDNDTVEVQFVDYGNIEECTIGSIKKKVILGDIPIQCIKCFIVGLIPDTEDGKWLTEDLDKIHALLVEKECKVSIVERMDTYLIISITLIKPTKCDLISYLTDELGIRLLPNSVNVNDSEVLNNTNSDNTSTDSPDVVIEQYTKEDTPDPEIYENAEMRIDDLISMHHIISGSSMVIQDHKGDTSCEEDCEALSLDNTETIKKEAVYSTPQVMSVENLASYIPLVIPDDIDTFEVELCCIVAATIHNAQLAENKHLKVLNDYYNQYKLLMDDIQNNAPKQPLLKNLVPNMPCCALFDDNMWYRCIIEKCEIVKDTNKVKVKLCYVDFGNKEKRQVTLDECGLHTLKEEWLSLPAMAIKCKLWRVSVPKNIEFFALTNELGKLYEMYNRYTFVKIKERYEDHLEVELYVDGNCTELLYGSLIKRGFLQIKKAKED